MTSTTRGSQPSQPIKPISKLLKDSIGKVIRKKPEEPPLDHHCGPHWRPSLNSILISSGSWTSESELESRPQEAQSTVSSGLLQLPAELRDSIEEYLRPADGICLRQTSQKLRYESRGCIEVRDLDAPNRHSLRVRLDRDYLPTLCALEQTSQLSNKLAVCSFCRSVHWRKRFTSPQLKLPPATRECSAVSRRYLVCGHYWVYPATLRQALDDALEVDDDEKTIHRCISEVRDSLGRMPTEDILSQAIENNPRLPDSRTRMFIDNTGLVLRHHFHLQSQSTTLPIGWNFAAALASPRKGIFAVCPHLTVHSAGIRLGRLDNVAEEYTGSCHERACRTIFGWFECESEFLGWDDLCFRVERRFGWLENVCDEFWRAQ